eukprot:TRINITY_DN9082_c0_g1_i1.p3 TRINITY_DN9082_c0_g1~~TRINITY_DN9082_c0_g1_i1.p3  ORF type:complete len:404 (+),score=121.78 TRINITY_DN9082_c0_g1_i1:79-1212(+)
MDSPWRHGALAVAAPPTPTPEVEDGRVSASDSKVLEHDAKAEALADAFSTLATRQTKLLQVLRADRPKPPRYIEARQAEYKSAERALRAECAAHAARARAAGCALVHEAREAVRQAPALPQTQPSFDLRLAAQSRFRPAAHEALASEEEFWKRRSLKEGLGRSALLARQPAELPSKAFQHRRAHELANPAPSALRHAPPPPDPRGSAAAGGRPRTAPAAPGQAAALAADLLRPHQHAVLPQKWSLPALQAEFSRIDTDGSGRISARELAEVWRREEAAFGVPVDKGTVGRVLRSVGARGLRRPPLPHRLKTDAFAVPVCGSFAEIPAALQPADCGGKDAWLKGGAASRHRAAEDDDPEEAEVGFDEFAALMLAAAAR